MTWSLIMIKQLFRASVTTVSIFTFLVGVSLPAVANNDEAIQSCVQTIPVRPSQNITGATLVGKVQENEFSYYLTSMKEVGNEWWAVVRMDAKDNCDVIFMDPTGSGQGFESQDIPQSVAIKLSESADEYIKSKQ